MPFLVKIKVTSPNDKGAIQDGFETPCLRGSAAGDHSARCRGLCAGFERSDFPRPPPVMPLPVDRLSEETKAPIFFPESERGFVTTAIRSGLGLVDVSGGKENG